MRRIFLAILLFTLGVAQAFAVSTTVTALTTSWQSLGAGPLLLSGNNGIFVISDANPGVGIKLGTPINSTPVQIQTSSNVWVELTDSQFLGSVISAPITAWGSAGGGATAANQINVQSAPGTPQTTAVTVQGNASGVPIPVTPGVYSYIPLTPGQHNLAIVGSTALTIPSTSTYATICASTATVKYTTDGTTAPTASIGQPLQVGSCVALSGATVLANFRAISATGTLDVEYFK